MRRLVSSVLGLATALPAFGRTPPELPVPLPETVQDPDLWLERRVEAETALGVWPQAMPRIHRNVDGKAETAILFIHGWGACRAEGEHVIDQLADEYHAAAKALDRVLLWNFYCVPHFNYDKQRYVYWDRFSRPDPLPKYGVSGFPNLWWYDADKAAKLKRS